MTHLQIQSQENGTVNAFAAADDASAESGGVWRPPFPAVRVQNLGVVRSSREEIASCTWAIKRTARARPDRTSFSVLSLATRMFLAGILKALEPRIYISVCWN